MTLFKRHMGRRVAAVGVAVALLVLGLATPAYAVVPGVTSVTPTTASDWVRGHDHRNELPNGTWRTCNVSSSEAIQGRAMSHRFGHPAGGHDSERSARRPRTPSSSRQRRSVTPHRSRTRRGWTPPVRASRPSRPRAASWAPRSRSAERSIRPPTGVRFNTSSLVTPTNPSATGATAVVPAGATTGPIHVYTAAGQATSATSFTVTPVPAPTITSFTPTFGPTGTSVKITGTNFSGTVSGASFTTTGVTFNRRDGHVRRELGDPDHGHRANGCHHRYDQGHDPGWDGDQRDQLHGEQAHSRSITLKLKKSW